MKFDLFNAVTFNPLICSVEGIDAASGGGTVDRGAVVKKVAKPKKVASKAKAKKTAKSHDSDLFDREKYQYEADKEHKTAGGRPSVNNGDRLATALTGKTGADMKKILKENGLEWNPEWDARNEGMQKMNASNRLRAAVKRGEKVKIDGKSIASL